MAQAAGTAADVVGFSLDLLTSSGTNPSIPSAKLSSLRFLGNVTLVERPIRSESLLSAVETALRARASANMKCAIS